MDKLQRSAVGFAVVIVIALAASFILPLEIDLGWKAIYWCLAIALLSPALLVLCAFAIIYGEQFETMLGPLGSDQRRKRVYTWLGILLVPGAGLAFVLARILMNHGYNLP